MSRRPAAIVPTTSRPDLTLSAKGTFPAKFDRYGFRVPMMVISPWGQPQYVSHQVADHTSILAFLEHKWNLPPLTRRDAAAWDLRDMFDVSQRRLADPPPLPPAPEHPVKSAKCRADGENPPTDSVTNQLPTSWRAVRWRRDTVAAISGRRRMVLGTLLGVAGVCAGLPSLVGAAGPPTAAPPGCQPPAITGAGFIILGHIDVISETDLPVCTTGSVTVSFHGDRSAGCARHGVCEVSGTDVWQPGTADLSVLAVRVNGRRRSLASISWDPGRRLIGAATRSTPDGTTTVCRDTRPAATAGVTAITPKSGYGGSVTVPLVGDGGVTLPTRCAGPLDVDLSAGPPGQTLARCPSAHASRDGESRGFPIIFRSRVRRLGRFHRRAENRRAGAGVRRTARHPRASPADGARGERALSRAAPPWSGSGRLAQLRTLSLSAAGRVRQPREHPDRSSNQERRIDRAGRVRADHAVPTEIFSPRSACPGRAIRTGSTSVAADHGATRGWSRVRAGPMRFGASIRPR